MLVQNYQPSYNSYTQPAFSGKNKAAKAIKKAAEEISRDTRSQELPPYNNAYNTVSIRPVHIVRVPRNGAPRIDELKTYMDNCSSHSVDPAEIRKILLNSGARDVTREQGIAFRPTADYKHGKKEKYELKGKTFILESHDKIDGRSSMDIDTRLYTEAPTKDERYYLMQNGTFAKDVYTSPCSHLSSGLKGKDWIGRA